MKSCDNNAHVVIKMKNKMLAWAERVKKNLALETQSSAIFKEQKHKIIAQIKTIKIWCALEIVILVNLAEHC